MTLEFDKLMGSLDSMARATALMRHRSIETAAVMAEALDRYAEDWPGIDAALERASALADSKHYRSARPVSDAFPLNAQLDPQPPPPQATIIATDGSQIMPDRHAAHLYYVINIGGIIYHHGQRSALEKAHTGEGADRGGVSRAPQPFSLPELSYPTSDREAAEFATRLSDVSIERDLKEIGILADKAWENRGANPPLLAMLDQRLLYWPVTGQEGASNDPVRRWLAAITKTHDSGAALAGYIDRPLTSAVNVLLASLMAMEDPGFDWRSLGRSSPSSGLTDAALFSRILEPGQRSTVFAAVSQLNEQFAKYDPDNEICFFYLNPGPAGRRIARIDVPGWVARDEAMVANVHALIYDQCRILGDYPYVLARADEMAVIGRRDHEELDYMIDHHMQRHGVSSRFTAKKGSKGLARGGKTRHRGL